MSASSTHCPRPSTGRVAGAAWAFPQVVDDYCLDGDASVAAYGEGAEGSIAEACRQRHVADCQLYVGKQTKRLFTARYASAVRKEAAVAVDLLQLSDSDAGFERFTRAVLGDGDPLASKLKPFRGGGRGALEEDHAYLWHGDFLLLLRFEGELEENPSSDSRFALARIASAIGEALPGSPALPEAVRRLPEERRIFSLAVRYRLDEILPKLGRGAIGFYLDPPTRWRALVADRESEAAAEALFAVVRHQPGAKRLDQPGLEAWTVSFRDAPGARATRWTLAREGRFLVGIGEEPAAGAKGAHRPLGPAAQLAKLKALLASVASR